MRHKKLVVKLNKKAPELKAMFNNMVASLLDAGSIKTTLPKAKALRPYIEKLITKAKNSDDLASFRYLVSKLNSIETARKMKAISSNYSGVNGGYTRIVKCGYRYGDDAPMAYIQLISDFNTRKKSSAVSA